MNCAELAWNLFCIKINKQTFEGFGAFMYQLTQNIKFSDFWSMLNCPNWAWLSNIRCMYISQDQSLYEYDIVYAGHFI